MAKLAWGRRLTPAQRQFLVEMARALGTDPSHNAAVIAFESRWNPRAVNQESGATGLIQFMPQTAIGMGTTVAEILEMGIDDQLRLCFAYWKPYAGRMRSLSDCYMAVLYPAAIGLPEDAVIFPAGSKRYLQNRGLDIDHDGAVTKAEAAAFVAKRLDEGLLDANAVELDATGASEPQVQPQPEAEGATMAGLGKVLDVATMITSIFNPMAGGMLGLAGQLVRGMEPAIQGKLAKEIGRHVDDPATAAAVAGDIARTLVSGAQAFTGAADPNVAVAQITANPAQAENYAKLAANLDAQLDRLTKAGDTSITWDERMWAAQDRGRGVVSSIAIAERQAGIWDMTRFLVMSLLIMLWGIAWGLGAGILVVAFSSKPDAMVLTALIGLAGPIWTGAIVASVVAIVAYRFDGSKQGSDQTKALLAAATRNPSGGSAVSVA